MGVPSRAEMRAIRQIRKILTVGQGDKAASVVEDIRGLGPAGLPMPALEKVDLSKEQWSKIHAIMSRNRPDGDEPPAPGLGRPDFWAIHDKVFAILTDGQKKIAKEFARRGPGGPGFGGPGRPGFGGPGGPDGQGD
jgi:hypothetical protein